VKPEAKPERRVAPARGNEGPKNEPKKDPKQEKDPKQDKKD
jgi:hypothetical protein